MVELYNTHPDVKMIVVAVEDRSTIDAPSGDQARSLLLLCCSRFELERAIHVIHQGSLRRLAFGLSVIGLGTCS